MDILDMFSSTLMLLFSVVGVICAVLFIVVVVFHRNLHKVSIMLALNSAVAGVIINVVCASQSVYQLTSDGNDYLCAFRGFLLHAATGLLYQTLCVQTFHRFFVVVFTRRRYLQSKKVMIFIVILQWLISSTFGIPALILDRIVYQPGSRICQASLNDLVIFLYLSMFIYFCPLAIIIPIYLRIVYFTKQHAFSGNAFIRVATQHRRRRDLQFIRRLLIIVGVIFFMSFPYLIFFLRAQFFPRAERIPYAQRISFVSLSFGYSVWMLLNLIFTDKVRKYIVDNMRARVHPPHTTVSPLRTITVGPTPR